jgi:hypothetical protein
MFRIIIAVSIIAGACASNSSHKEVNSPEPMGEVYQDTAAASIDAATISRKTADVIANNHWVSMKINPNDTLPYFKFANCNQDYSDIYPGDRCVSYHARESESGFEECIPESIVSQKDLRLCSLGERYIFAVKTKDKWKRFPYLSPAHYDMPEEVIDSVLRFNINGTGTDELIFYWSSRSEGNGGNSSESGITIIDPDSEMLLFEDNYNAYSGGWSDSTFVTSECKKHVAFGREKLTITIMKCNTSDVLKAGMVEEYVLRKGVFVRSRR